MIFEKQSSLRSQKEEKKENNVVCNESFDLGLHFFIHIWNQRRQSLGYD